jgi:hypothetical protein
MAKLHARNTQVDISDDGGSTWDDISDMCTSVSVEDQTEAADVTTFGGDGYKEFIDGFTEGSVSAEGYYDPTLFALVIAARSAAAKSLRIRPNGTGTGEPQLVFDITGMQISTSFNVNDPSGCSFSATISGPIDYTAQS